MAKTEHLNSEQEYREHYAKTEHLNSEQEYREHYL